MLMDSDPYKRGIRQKILTIVQHSRRLLTREDHLSFSTEERNRLLSDLLHLEQTATFPGTTSAQLSWLYQRAIDLYNNYLQQRGKRASTSNERTDTSAEEEEHTIPYKPVPIGQHVLPPLPYPMMHWNPTSMKRPCGCTTTNTTKVTWMVSTKRKG
ncbi:hypothetical protein SAMN05421790_11315 [Kroppenstedtia eburnea]|uniref:Uncharacterized protein n=1 Tax=Kroppenstedtia eburnea TaxID=714067 RepID=A0A1N7PKF4_9BACL|nr:hypothetical protein SAMN05421790_11315 [Kroppenstedtia eburnea]